MLLLPAVASGATTIVATTGRNTREEQNSAYNTDMHTAARRLKQFNFGGDLDAGS